MKKKTTQQNEKKVTAVPRPPVVAIMGHIDHGKSTLLDYIRRSNTTAKEAGGITQHLGAYEIIRETENGERRITFLDTPGHAAFGGIRERSAEVADVAILVVSGEEGVKPQTVEAKKCIDESGIPFIVAVTKIDSPKADMERTRQSLAEHEIFVEGYGGNISSIGVSGKTGDGIPELIDLIILTADLAELTYDPAAPFRGIVVESHRDEKRGIAATIVAKDGTLRKGSWLSSGGAATPVRFIENDAGKNIESAGASTPVRILGWSSLPSVGALVTAHENRKEAEAYVATFLEHEKNKSAPAQKDATEKDAASARETLFVILKADNSNSLEALEGEVARLQTDKVRIHSLGTGIGDVTENDIKLARTKEGCLILGFGVGITKHLAHMAERENISVMTFDIIYKLTEVIENIVREKTPDETPEETTARIKILKVFSAEKDKQIVGGRVEEGTFTVGSAVKIIRRDAEIGKGKVRNLEQGRSKTTSVQKGSEFGAMIESKIIIAQGDIVESFVEKK